MRGRNLISVYQGSLALANIQVEFDREFKILKDHEILNLQSLCNIMENNGCKIEDFDCYFVGYCIGQIGKEFDLLRFSENLVINIELKSQYNSDDKILKQMQKNYYYLKALQREVKIFTYVENVGFYKFDVSKNTLMKTNIQELAQCIKNQKPDYTIDPDKVFVPSYYLISPFNSASRFIDGEYFLTTAQQSIKEEIISEINANKFCYITISANAGTGKTLLLYDVAKNYLLQNKKLIMIHCGDLNSGHIELNEMFNWNIIPVKEILNAKNINEVANYKLILIDEAQRIKENQIKALINISCKNNIPIIFTYDKKQCMFENEDIDIEEYLDFKTPNISLFKKRLTTKIRTNKEMSSFISNLLKIGTNKEKFNYDCVTIEYIDNIEDLKEYMLFLADNEWQTIIYDSENYNREPYDFAALLGEKTSQSVIGQEFAKVAFIMDENFTYKNNRLVTKDSNYSAKGMLYQIVTRVVNDLKIIVYKNPDLYLKLLEIHVFGKSKK